MSPWPWPASPSIGHARGLGISLSGRFPAWVSAKDVILELLRRLTVKGGYGKILEYSGPALAHLSAPERATIANMGAELGATTSIFPSDALTRKFLRPCRAGRRTGAPSGTRGSPGTPGLRKSNLHLEPLIACPSSPDKVVPVREMEGLPVDQVLSEFCANSSLRDLMTVCRILAGRRIPPQLSLDVNPGSRQVLENVAGRGAYVLLLAGAQIISPGAGAASAWGRPPATGQVSLRTFTEQFPWSQRHQGGQGLSLHPRDRRCGGRFRDVATPGAWGSNRRMTNPAITW